MADQKLTLDEKPSNFGLPPPPLPTNRHQSAEITINTPQPGETPTSTICSYNKCEGCKAMYPIAGVALANCPGCQQPTILLKLTNCPKCNEPTKSIRLRVDHVSDKMPHGRACKGELGMGDVYFVDIEVPLWREDDKRIKDTSTRSLQGNEFTVTEKGDEDSPEVAKRERGKSGNGCGCGKAKTG